MASRIDVPVRPNPHDRVLLVQLGEIGDVVVTLPLVRALRKTFPHCRLGVLVHEKARELIEDCPWADEVFAVDSQSKSFWRRLRRQLSLVRNLRRQKYDFVLDVRCGSRGAFLSRLSGAPVRVGHLDIRRNWCNRFFTHLARPPRWDHLCAAEQNLKIASILGLGTQDPVPRIVVPPDRKKRVSALLAAEGAGQDRPLLAVHPFSLRKEKEWGLDSWTSLIRRMAAEHDCTVAVTGAPGDRDRAQAMLERCPKGVLNLAGKTSLGELAGLLEACFLLVSVDTCAAHIAAAVGTSAVVLYGPSDPTTWKPQGPDHVALHRRLPQPPVDGLPPVDPAPDGSLLGLGEEEVWNAVDSTIRRLLPLPRSRAHLTGRDRPNPQAA